MTTFFIAGFIGGVFRGGVGLVKYSTSYKDVTIRPWYFSGMVVLSGVVGAAAAWVTHDLGIAFLGVKTLSPALGVVVGYAGGDFIENIFKILVKEPNLFKNLPISLSK